MLRSVYSLCLTTLLLALMAGNGVVSAQETAQQPATPAAVNEQGDEHGDATHPAEAHADDAHANDTHAGDAHHEEHETGLPMKFKSDLALWTLVTFILFVLVLRQFAWAPLTKALDAREAGIRKDIADAESNRLKSESMLREYESKLSQTQEEVKAIIAEARRDAEQVKQDIVATAQREAEATRQRAVGEIERARDVAMSELFDFVSNNVVQATEKVLQRSLTGDDQDRLVREALSQMDIRKN